MGRTDPAFPTPHGPMAGAQVEGFRRPEVASRVVHRDSSSAVMSVWEQMGLSLEITDSEHGATFVSTACDGLALISLSAQIIS